MTERPKQGDIILAGTTKNCVSKRVLLGFTDDGKAICVCANDRWDYKDQTNYPAHVFGYWEPAETPKEEDVYFQFINKKYLVKITLLDLENLNKTVNNTITNKDELAYVYKEGDEWIVSTTKPKNKERVERSVLIHLMTK